MGRGVVSPAWDSRCAPCHPWRRRRPSTPPLSSSCTASTTLSTTSASTKRLPVVGAEATASVLVERVDGMNGLPHAERRYGDFARGKRWAWACLALGQRGKGQNRWAPAGSCWRRIRWSRGVPPRWVPSQGRSIRLLVTGGAPLPPRPPGWGTEYPLPPLASVSLQRRCVYCSEKVRNHRPVTGRAVPCWRNPSRERGAEVMDTRRPRPRWVRVVQQHSIRSWTRRGSAEQRPRTRAASEPERRQPPLARATSSCASLHRTRPTGRCNRRPAARSGPSCRQPSTTSRSPAPSCPFLDESRSGKPKRSAGLNPAVRFRRSANPTPCCSSQPFDDVLTRGVQRRRRILHQVAKWGIA